MWTPIRELAEGRIIATQFTSINLPQYVFHHVSTMAKLITENRYDRLTSDVQKLTGKPSMSIREYVTAHPEVFFTAQSRVI